MPQTKTQIHVGHSPDPDDAFMFHALANNKIDTGNYEFTHTLQDIETLNRRAFKGELELTAVSLHGYAYLTDTYALCACGASMGEKYGPMVVAREPMKHRRSAGQNHRRARHLHHGVSDVETAVGRRFHAGGASLR